MRNILVMALAMMTLQMAAQSETKNEKMEIKSYIPESKTEKGTSSNSGSGTTPKHDPSGRDPKGGIEPKGDRKPCVNPSIPKTGIKGPCGSGPIHPNVSTPKKRGEL